MTSACMQKIIPESSLAFPVSREGLCNNKNSPALSKAPGCFYCLFQNDADLAVGFISDAFAFYIGMLAQLQVNDAPFSSGHRFKDLALACANGLFSHAAGKLTELAFTAGAVTFHVYHDLYPMAGFFADNERQQVL